MNNARSWPGPEGTAGVPAMMTAMPPVACTAMNAELVKNEPASVPNRYPYGPDSGLTPASTAAARPPGTLSTPSTRPAMASSRRVPRPTRNRTLTDYRPTEFLVGAGGHRHRQTHIARSGETWRARLRQRRTSPARLVTQQHSIDRGRHRPVGTDRETAGGLEPRAPDLWELVEHGYRARGATRCSSSPRSRSALVGGSAR